MKSFFVRLKPLLPILLFVTFFREDLLSFPEHIFLNAFQMKWCLILPKVQKAYRVVLVSLLLTLTYIKLCYSASIVNFEHVTGGWERNFNLTI